MLTKKGENRAVRILTIASELGLDLRGGANRDAMRTVLEHEDVMADSVHKVSMDIKIDSARVLIWIYEETVKQRLAMKTGA